ncbi:hypothetical protein H6B10_17420, partial [Gemmiger formicilis]|nr:hypothetical protein [Gemmiger formicilis]
RKETIRAFYEAMRSEPKLTDGQTLSERSVEGLHNTLCSFQPVSLVIVAAGYYD